MYEVIYELLEHNLMAIGLLKGSHIVSVEELVDLLYVW